LGFANALPSDEVVPNVSRANADDSLIVLLLLSLPIFIFY
jgi:hypothetical protein